MQKIKQLLASPEFMRSANGWFAVFWLVMTPVSLYFQWTSSVTYVSALSLWALVASHWSGYQSGRVEVEQIRQKEETA